VPALAEGGEEDPRALARDGLVGLGYTFAEAEKLLEGADGTSPEDLIAAALRRSATEAA
jgi:holliday junction DNA helicase RuvA